MSDEAALADVADVLGRLRAAIASNRLSSTGGSQAAQMLERLETGVRLVLAGPQGSGKTGICSLLLGSAQALSTSPSVATRYTGANAAIMPASAEPAADATRTIRLPAPFLASLQITDVAGAADAAEQQERMNRALGAADMVLWCTTDVTVEDLTFWAEMPEALKDHSFLVLTKADLLVEPGELAARIRKLQLVAEQEFHSLFPTSTRAGTEMLFETGDLSEACRSASGVKALSDAVLRLAASGRRADLDGALLFLQRQGLGDILPESAISTADRTDDATVGRERLLKLMQDALAAQEDLSPEPDEAQAGTVLTWCGALCEDLCARAEKQEAAAGIPELLREALHDASDRMVLLSLENDLRSAADAASILLQIRRDFECFPSD